MMINTIAFDIGNVLVDFDYLPYVHNLLQDEEAVNRVNNAIWLTGCWNDLDRGEDTDEVVQRMLEAEPGYKEEILLTFERVGECITLMDYAIPWIQELKQRGYRVLYLSNYARHTMDVNREALRFLPLMDGGVFSCDIGCIKPDARMYETLCRNYALDPACCVFLDDMEANVQAAAECGMQTIQFQNYEQAKTELEALLAEKQA